MGRRTPLFHSLQRVVIGGVFSQVAQPPMSAGAMKLWALERVVWDVLGERVQQIADDHTALGESYRDMASRTR
jgi:hypothetical protein